MGGRSPLARVGGYMHKDTCRPGHRRVLPGHQYFELVHDVSSDNQSKNPGYRGPEHRIELILPIPGQVN